MDAELSRGLCEKRKSRTERLDVHWARHAAGLRAAGNPQCRTIGETGCPETVCKTRKGGQAAPGHLCAGHLQDSHRAGVQSAPARRAMSVVVVERQEEAK